MSHPSLWQNSWKQSKQREEMFISLPFQGCQYLVTWHVVSRPVSRWVIMEGSMLERPLTEQEEGLSLNTSYENVSSVTSL